MSALAVLPVLSSKEFHWWEIKKNTIPKETERYEYKSVRGKKLKRKRGGFNFIPI